MRLQGTITKWKDEQGFGFIAPSDGGPQVFVHIKSFVSGRRRPVENDVVHYETASDGQGRIRAVNVVFEGGIVPKEAGVGVTPLVFPALFLVLVAGAVLVGRLPVEVLAVDLVASVIAFTVYDSDKRAAMRGSWRTAESTLHFVALMGGWPGAFVAQRVLRHKSSKVSFLTVFWLTVMLNVGAHLWLLIPSGSQELRKLLDAVRSAEEPSVRPVDWPIIRPR